MSPREWYSARVSHWAAVHDLEERRATRLSRLRLATFFAGAALVWAGLDSGIALLTVLGIVSFAAFGVLVALHGRKLLEVARAAAAQSLNAIGRARLDRDWRTLPPIPDDPSSCAQPAFALDLDVIGPASLRQWIGGAATTDGNRRVRAWLLTPAEPGTILERQAAIVELAEKALWRESLVTEGELAAAPPRDLDRFLEWAERDDPAVPASLRVVVPVLTVAILAPLGAQAVGWTAAAWWLGPMLAGVVLSFALASHIYRTFDTVSIGERALLQHAAMFALAENEAWSTPALRTIAGRLRQHGGASRVTRQLARLAQWSELRRAAALLHFPIEAFTLWDFHVLFAIERWRRRCGPYVRGWFDALAEIDATATLAAIRYDEPEWCLPRIDDAAVSIEARALGHPLIPGDRRVGNDVTVGPPGTLLLVTGSNMSGKSTLLRAIGLNVLLAQAGAPVCAAEFTLPPCDLETSVRVQDSLERGLSYFMAALARLKGVIDAADRERSGSRRLLYLLDELLQGTNSAERATAVRAIARHLLASGAIGAMTTHDLAVAAEEPFASQARLVHFSEQVHADGTMTFDYVLRPGLATSRNALRLMQLIGIEPR
jgi:hypothetical protein